MLTQEKLKEVLDYDAETGVFTRRISLSKGKGAGVAGSTNHCGLHIIMIRGKMFLAHRLAWLYVYGYFPELLITHINKIRNDNRIANLCEKKLAKVEKGLGLK